MMKSVLMFLFMACALLPEAEVRAQAAQEEDYLVSPVSAEMTEEELEATGITVVDAGHPIFYEGPKLEFLLVGEDKQPLDSVTLRVFDAEHRLLGEYCSSGREHLLMPALIVLVDTAVINCYGTYYVEASKPGYRTEKIRYDLTEPKLGKNMIEGFKLKREEESGKDDSGGKGGGAWLAVAAAVVVAGGAWWLARRRR